MKRRLLLARLAAASFALLPLHVQAAESSNASTAIRHFGEACLKNLGNPKAVRDWAELNRLPPMSHPRMRAIMLGEGAGSAWGLPSRTDQRFGLSLKYANDTCAVWAEAADATELRALFEQVIKGITGPSLDVKKAQDVASPAASGNGRTLTFLLSAKGAHAGFQISLITATGSLYDGAPIQASLQVGPVRVD